MILIPGPDSDYGRLDPMIHYKGFEVVPRAIELDDHQWRAEVALERHRADQVRRRTFPIEDVTFEHEADAMEAALERGRQVLDGERPGETVEDL